MLVLTLMLALAVSTGIGESVQAGVSVKLRPAGDIYEGDTVTLRAEVSGAEEGSYSVLWQKKTVADDGSVKWKKLAEGRKYDLTAAAAIEGMVIRAVLVIGDSKIFSEPVAIPKILTKAAPDPTEVPDTGSEEDPTPDPTGKQTEVRDPEPDATPTPALFPTRL